MYIFTFLFINLSLHYMKKLNLVLRHHKGAQCSFGEEIQTHNLNLYNVN